MTSQPGERPVYSAVHVGPLPAALTPRRSAALLVWGLVLVVLGRLLWVASLADPVAREEGAQHSVGVFFGVVLLVVGVVMVLVGVWRLASNVDGLAERAALRDAESAAARAAGQQPR